MTDCGAPTADQEDRWGDVLVEVLDALDRGEPPDVPVWQARYPDFAAELARFLDGQARVDRYASPLRVLADAATAVTPVGGTLGDYRIVREVGRGGMGVVYEAEQISLGRRVALKVLPLAATMDPRQLARFRHEAKAAAMLHHPHVVPVYGVGCERGVHFFAMQLIDGRSLADVIGEMRQGRSSGSNGSHYPQGSSGASGAAGAAPPSPGLAGWGTGVRAASAPDRNAPSLPSPLPQSRERGARNTAPVAALSTKNSGPDRPHYRRVAELIAQAADALEYAHSMGVVHRDVKPANLMLDNGGHLWVTDFGLARLGDGANLTVSGDLLGTLRYMSPEQALAKHGLVDHRTDVYSLGATLYELLTLRPAVEGEGKQEVLRRIAFEDPAAPRKLDKAIPAELETVALKALAKDPAERYDSAEEFAADLRRWLSGVSIRARPVGPFWRLWRWCGRNRLATGLVAFALTSLAAALVAATVGYARTSAALTLAVAQRERARDGFNIAQNGLADLTTTLDGPEFDGVARIDELRATLAGRGVESLQRMVREQIAPLAEEDVMRCNVTLGQLYAIRGDHARAAEILENVVRFHETATATAPADASLRHWLAHSRNSLAIQLRRLGVPARADELFRQAIRDFEASARLAPGNARFWNNMAFVIAASERPDICDPARAVEAALRATGLSPDVGTYWNTLGEAYYATADWPNALAAVQRSTERDAGQPANDFFLLARIHWQLGDRATARSWYEQGMHDLARTKGWQRSADARRRAAKVLDIPLPRRAGWNECSHRN